VAEYANSLQLVLWLPMELYSNWLNSDRFTLIAIIEIVERGKAKLDPNVLHGVDPDKCHVQ